ncbi:hypothetical protein GIB67_006741, partial [Kingdonia uniflora]
MGLRNEHVARAVVIGDEGTGKSTLIKTALNKTFTDDVPPIMPPTTLLINGFDNGGHINGPTVPVIVIDTSVHTQESTDNLLQELQLTDVVILTVSYDKPSSFHRLSSFWLPELHRLKVKVPIIVVGCKLDLRNDTQVSLEQIVSPIMQQFLEIDIFIDCSARNLIKFRAAFFQAWRLAICPTTPLFDKVTQTLKPRCVMALEHIFMVCDRDRDGALSDAELCDLQIKCFDTPMGPPAIARYKEIVQELESKGVNERGISLDGFLAFHLRLSKRRAAVNQWKCLLRFGFDNDVYLRDDLFHVLLKRAIGNGQNIKLNDDTVDFLKSTFSLFDPDLNFELTDEAIEFLKSTFSLFDLDKDGVLQPAELDKLFSTSPECPWDEAPYKDAGESTVLGSLSTDGFLSKWALMALLDPCKSLLNLIYIGYRKDLTKAICITKRKGLDCKKEDLQRNVFQCFVFGPKNAGKSELLNAFLGRPFLGSYSSTSKERFAVKCLDNFPVCVGFHSYAFMMLPHVFFLIFILVQFNLSYNFQYFLVLQGIRKTLVLREIPEDEVGHSISNKEFLAACDVAIFVHDSSEKSWNKATNLLIEVASHAKDSGLEVPCLIVTAKDDLDPYGRALKKLTWASRQMGLHAAIPVSSKLGDLNNLFDTIVSTAEQPHLSIPVTEAWEISKTENINNNGFDRIIYSEEQPHLSIHPTG